VRFSKVLASSFFVVEFHCHISIIIGHRPEPEMSWIYAGRTIASMHRTNPLWDWADESFVD